MHTKAEALKRKISGVKNKVIDVTSDVISYPKRLKESHKRKQGNQDLHVIKVTRDFDKQGASNVDYKGDMTEASKYRAERNSIAHRYKNQK